MSYQIIYPLEQSGSHLPEGEPANTPSDYCAIEIQPINLDGLVRSSYNVKQASADIETQIHAEPLPINLVRERFLNVLFPDRYSYKPLEGRLISGEWVCFEGNPEERREFRAMIEDWLAEVSPANLLQKLYGFDRLKVQEITPKDEDLAQRLENLLTDWNLKDQGMLPKNKYLDTVYLINLDEESFKELASQDYWQKDFWRVVFHLKKLGAKIVVFSPCGGYLLTDFVPGGLLVSSAPLICDVATLLTHDLKTVKQQWKT